MRNAIIILVLLVGAAIFWTCFYFRVEKEMRIEAQEIKPFQTYYCLMNIADGCDWYKERFGKWPDTLAQVTTGRPDLADRSTDSWGRIFIFVPYKESAGFGEVISYGRDGKPGGTGDDRDLEIRFPTDLYTNWNEKEREGLRGPRFAY